MIAAKGLAAIGVGLTLVVVGDLFAPITVRAAGPWYVNGAIGNDTYDCLHASVVGSGQGPCLTVAGAYGKAVAGDTINVAGGVYPTSLIIDKDIVIAGTGSTRTFLDGGGTSRIFRVLPRVTFTVREAALRNGATDGLTGGGALRNEGTAFLANAAVTGSAHRAIYNTASATLTISDTALTDNPNGAIENHGAILGVRTFFVDNRASLGGAILNANGSVTLVSTIIRDNSATSRGGGIVNSAGAELKLTVASFEGNAAPAGGGLDADGTVRIEDSTFSGNVAGTGGGGGIRYDGREGKLEIVQATVVGNHAEADGAGIRVAAGTVDISFATIATNTTTASTGGLRRDSGTVRVWGSVLGDNAGSDCSSGTIVSAGFNVFENTTGCGVAPGDAVGLDPLLLPLRDNGGSPNAFVTRTRGLSPGSPAISRMFSISCPDLSETLIHHDQRFRYRPQEIHKPFPLEIPACDVGAYELDREGGKGFRIGTTDRSIVSTWTRGGNETAYYLHRFGIFGGSSATLGPFAVPKSMPHHDSPAGSDLFCYIVLPYNNGVVALSDLQCAYRGVAAGTLIPQDFGLQLNESTVANLTWLEPPGGVDRYTIVEWKVFENQTTTTDLPSGYTQKSFELTVPGPTCYVLAATKGSQTGNTDMLCGVPGVGTGYTPSVPPIR